MQRSSAQDNRIGAAWMVTSMAAFTVNDAFMKALGMEWPLFQSIFLRGLGVTLIAYVLAARLGQLTKGLPAKEWRLMGIRTLCECVAAFLFISAIFNMPLAEATAIIQTLPLTVTLAGALFLKEPVGWRRWLAIAIGFLGVLMIIRPGLQGVSIYALYAVGAVIAVTIRDIAARRMAKNVPSLLAALVSAGGVTLAAGLASLTETWAPLTPSAAGSLFGAMAVVLLAYVASVSAMRFGDISAVAPFRYTAILVALALGVIVFDERPDALTLIGVGLIVAAGLFTMARERRVAATAPPPTATASVSAVDRPKDSL